MLKSRAITTSFRFYVGLAAAALVGAVVAALSSNDTSPLMDRLLGPLSVGWKGAVGDHLAYTVLLGVAVVAGTVGAVLTAFRDADAEALAEMARAGSVPLTRAPAGANYWPLVSVFGVSDVLIGLSIDNKALAFAGAAVLTVAVVVWTLRSWAERATGDELTNLALYHHLVEPLRVPALAVGLVGLTVVGFSRVLLALPNKNSSVAFFGLLGVAVLIGSVALAAKPRISRTTAVVVVFVLGVAVIVGGIVGAVKGPRSFEHHPVPGHVQVGGPGT